MHQIVIIEDDRDIRNASIEFLEMEGYLALGHENGLIAMEYLKLHLTELPELLIVDLNMPVMNGHAFRRAQLAEPAFSHIPCVLISANDRHDQMTLELGFSEILRKPIDLDKLIAVVRKYVINE